MVAWTIRSRVSTCAAARLPILYCLAMIFLY
jgi:hypothetical protein